ncbi:MAG TPA: hypothetical protein VMG59_08850 [Phycisphaerae bacterium]|nr:hypothetical protein [Phycisphaerae bacterium]
MLSLPADPPSDTQVKFEYPGQVYAMRGFIGVWSLGIDDLVYKLNTGYVIHATVLPDYMGDSVGDQIKDAWREGKLSEPLILVGHSWGADDQVRAARELNKYGIPVTLLLLLDPVTPPEVPPNVGRCICIYKSHPDTDFIPVWRGVPVVAEDPQKTWLTDINLRTADVGFDTTPITHVNIVKNPNILQMEVTVIKQTCAAWQVWHAAEAPNSPATTQ